MCCGMEKNLTGKSKHIQGCTQRKTKSDCLLTVKIQASDKRFQNKNTLYTPFRDQRLLGDSHLITHPITFITIALNSESHPGEHRHVATMQSSQ